MRKVYITIGVLTVIAISFVAGDYFRLFGITKTARLDHIQVNFKTVDEETGAPVVDVHARCFQKMNRNACSEVDSGRAGYTSLKIPVHRIITRSHLFEQNVEMVETADPKLHIMFIHYDYANPVETFMTADLPEMEGKEFRITMPKKLQQPGSDPQVETAEQG